MTELTEDKLEKELKSNKTLGEIAEKYDTNKSRVFNMKEDLGYELLKTVMDTGREKRISISEVLTEMGLDDPDYWSYEIENDKLVIDFFDCKWQKSGFSKRNRQTEEKG